MRDSHLGEGLLPEVDEVSERVVLPGVLKITRDRCRLSSEVKASFDRGLIHNIGLNQWT
jgi:hypothetical protein